MRQTRFTSGGRTLSADRTAASQDKDTPPYAATRPPQEPTLSDVMSTLQGMNSSMNSKLDDVKQDITLMREEYAALRGEVEGLREEVSTLRLDNDDLKKTNCDLTTRVDELEKKTDDLEGRSKRNNLIFYGLPRRENETGVECEGMLTDLITDKLELPDNVEFDRVHRLGTKPNSPVIARCVFYKQKVKILKAKRKLQGTQIFIGEDFSSRVREIRRRLTPHLKVKRNEGCRVSMVFDHLLVDGRRYSLDEEDHLVEMK
jgi:regulator of replication initiation timing